MGCRGSKLPKEVKRLTVILTESEQEGGLRVCYTSKDFEQDVTLIQKSEPTRGGLKTFQTTVQTGNPEHQVSRQPSRQEPILTPKLSASQDSEIMIPEISTTPQVESSSEGAPTPSPQPNENMQWDSRMEVVEQVRASQDPQFESFVTVRPSNWTRKSGRQTQNSVGLSSLRPSHLSQASKKNETRKPWERVSHALTKFKQNTLRRSMKSCKSVVTPRKSEVLSQAMSTNLSTLRPKRESFISKIEQKTTVPDVEMMLATMRQQMEQLLKMNADLVAQRQVKQTNLNSKPRSKSAKRSKSQPKRRARSAKKSKSVRQYWRF